MGVSRWKGADWWKGAASGAPTWTLCLLFAAPALAQMPNAGDTPPNAPLPPVTAPAPFETAPTSTPPDRLPEFDAFIGSLSGPLNRPHISDFRTVYGHEVTFNADKADADLRAGRRRYTLSGDVRLHETDTTLRAENIVFDGTTQSAVALNAILSRKVFTIHSARIEGKSVRGVTPKEDAEVLTATDADLTIVPPGERADLRLHAQTITLEPATTKAGRNARKAYRGVLRNASLYLFGARLLTVPRITFHTGAGGDAARRQTMLPTVGVSARYGTYLAFGNSLRVARLPVQYRLLLPTRQSFEATVTSQQTLYAPPVPAVSPPTTLAGPMTLLDRIRAFATAPVPVLPDGDPLRFHDFLPEPNPIRLFDTPSRGGVGFAEELSVHVAAQGRLRDDLYVSRLPEVTLRGQLPLTPPPGPPAYGDPQAFRAALRHLVFYADAQETVGEYREQPTNVNARRVRTQFGLNAYPLLIAPNTVFQPRVSVSTSGYSGSKKAYRYDQLDIAVNHYFSDLTAVGVQFLASNTSGDSPFNFDVLDTSREMDFRLQVGSRHFITALRVRYDLSHYRVIDYQIALAPALGGFIPVFSYNLRTRSVGLGVEIKDITF